MKLKIVIIATLLLTLGISIIGYTQSSNKSSSQRAQQREQRHIEREKRRATRQAEYERYIDSLVLARNFQFNPQSMQQQPAGSMRLLNNPNFELSVWGSEVDISSEKSYSEPENSDEAKVMSHPSCVCSVT